MNTRNLSGHLVLREGVHGRGGGRIGGPHGQHVVIATGSQMALVVRPLQPAHILRVELGLPLQMIGHAHVVMMNRA